MALIGIDLGTSFIKSAVLDLDTQQIDHVHRIPFPDPIPGLPPLHREYDPNHILAAIHRLLDELAPYTEDCEGLVMCSQMHGLVWTTERGEPRSNLTTWTDQRALMPHLSGKGTYFDVMKARITPAELAELGNELYVMRPLSVMFWLAEQGRLPGSDVLPASLPDFVLSNLCGSIPVTEATHAMSHGALNVQALGWHQSVIGKFGLDGVRWPEIKPHGSVVGYMKLGARTIPCYTPVGDFQCAMVGALLRYGELSLNISTGSQVSLLKPRFESGDFHTRPFFDGRYLITVVHIPAGRSLSALVKLFSELAEGQHIEIPDPWAYIARAAAAIELPNLRANVAFFDSACGDQGAITHIREDEMTIGHVFRAAFENMADNYQACALRLSPDQAWSNLVFSGGLAQKIEVLRQLICDRFQSPYRMCPTAEDTLLGLTALGMAFTGRTESVEQATNQLFDIYRSEIFP